MTERINRAEFTTREMLSKYEESARNAGNIESVVGDLMRDLGIGGFMGVQDVRTGMKISIAFGTGMGKKEFTGEVTDCKDNEVYVTVNDGGQDIVDRREKHAVCQLRIVVDNVLYNWDDIEIVLAGNGENGKYKLIIENNPQVFNRRKYPRMPLTNSCVIKADDKSCSGRMVNISANGLAFVSREPSFADMKGKNVVIAIKDFDILDGRELEAHIIRVSNNDGEYIIGCRMPQDNNIIKEYVSKRYGE